MKINFYATLRQITGRKTVEFQLSDGVNIREMVDVIVIRFPPLRQELLDEEGNLWPHVHVFVNGRDAPYLDEGMETILKPEDKVNIFPPVAGG